MKYFIILLIAVIVSSASAASWSGGVQTNSDSWSIYRQSNTIEFTWSSPSMEQ